MKEKYFTYAEIDELVIPMIKELFPSKAKEIYYKELSNPRIIEIIYINPKTGVDEIPYGTELQLNRYDLLNIIRKLKQYIQLQKKKK